MELPLELWLAIFDHLDIDQDRPTLIACTRSCKALVPPSYYRLYHKITLGSIKAARCFTETIQSPLISLHPPGKYVRRLSIICYRLTVNTLNSILPILARHLPGVTFLRLVAPGWTCINNEAKSALITGFQTVRELSLANATFDQEDHMLQFTASFPCLTHLTSLYYHARNPPTQLIPFPSRLKVLYLSTRFYDTFERHLRIEPRPNVRSLHIDIVPYQSMHAIGRLLELLGPNLESLTFHGEVDRMWKDTSRDVVDLLLSDNLINLSHNSNLRSITIRCGLYYNASGTQDRDPSAFWALSLLSQITSPFVSEIHLPIVACQAWAVDHMDWATLDRILVQPLWHESLRRVLINVSEQYNELSNAHLDRVRLRLPLISAAPGLSLMVTSERIPGEDYRYHDD